MPKPCCLNWANSDALFLSLADWYSALCTPSLPPPKAPALIAWADNAGKPFAACWSKSAIVVSITSCWYGDM